MNGVEDFLVIPGGDYSPVTGLDISKGPLGQTFKIDPDNTGYRHWQTAVANSSATFETTPGFTALSFETENFNGKAFNTTGSDWAADGADHFIGYHGRNRGRYTFESSTGKVSKKGSNDSEDRDNHNIDDHHGPNHSGDPSSRCINLPVFSVSLTSLAYPFLQFQGRVLFRSLIFLLYSELTTIRILFRLMNMKFSSDEIKASLLIKILWKLSISYLAQLKGHHLHH